MKFSGGIRYTVPTYIAPEKVHAFLKIRFRVGDVMTNRKVVLYLNGKAVSAKKRRVMAPGEMEEIVLTEKLLKKYPDVTDLEIKVEEDA